MDGMLTNSPKELTEFAFDFLEGKAAKSADAMDGLDHLAMEETEEESGRLLR